MLFRTPHALKSVDERLHPFLSAQTPMDAERELNAIIDKYVRSRCRAILKPRIDSWGGDSSDRDSQEDLEDVTSMVIIKMLHRLIKMREEYQKDQSIAKPIQDIEKYSAVTAFSAWRNYLRERKPVFHRVYQLVRALLTHHEPKDKKAQMAAWEASQGNRSKIWVGGFAKWRNQKPPNLCSERLHTMLDNPKAGITEAWDAARQSEKQKVCDALSHEGLGIIFTWIKHPVTLNCLTKILCEATDRIDAPMVRLIDIENVVGRRDEESVSVWIQFIWFCIRTKMTLREGRILLMGAEDAEGKSLIHNLILEESVSHQHMATVLQISLDKLSALLPLLPLEGDQAIAKAIGITEQSVRDGRRDGRAKLREALAEMLSD